jgi:hypothetical protein
MSEKPGLLLEHFEAWWKARLPMPGTPAAEAEADVGG